MRRLRLRRFRSPIAMRRLRLRRFRSLLQQQNKSEYTAKRLLELIAAMFMNARVVMTSRRHLQDLLINYAVQVRVAHHAPAERQHEEVTPV